MTNAAGLTESQAEVEQLLDAISSVLIGVDGKGAIAHWNRAAEDTVGLAASQVLGLPFRDCGIRWSWDAVHEWLRACRGEEGSPKRTEFRFTRPEGCERIFGVTFHPSGNRENDGFVLLGTERQWRLRRGTGWSTRCSTNPRSK